MNRCFTQHLSCTYKRPKAYPELLCCTQETNESSRDFIARWTEMKNSCKGVSEMQAIHAFMHSLKKGNMMRYILSSQRITTLGDLLDGANNLAIAEDDARADDGDAKFDISINNSEKQAKSANNKAQPIDNAGPSNEVAFAYSKG